MAIQNRFVFIFNDFIVIYLKHDLSATVIHCTSFRIKYQNKNTPNTTFWCRMKKVIDFGIKTTLVELLDILQHFIIIN